MGVNTPGLVRPGEGRGFCASRVFIVRKRGSSLIFFFSVFRILDSNHLRSHQQGKPPVTFVKINLSSL